MVQNGLIPIAYRRDVRLERVLLGVFYFSAWACCIDREPIAHAYVRMKDFDPYTNKQCIHLHVLPLMLLSPSRLHPYSCVTIRRLAGANHTYLPAVQHAHAGARGHAANLCT